MNHTPTKKDFSRIYLDFNATTPIHPSVLSSLEGLAEDWGNASSIHWYGRGPKNILREVRQSFSHFLNVSPLEIIFTSGGSEGNNNVIRGVYESLIAHGEKDFVFVTSQVEHPSVIKAFKYLETLGLKTEYIQVNRSGELDIQEYQRVLEKNKVKFVSIMAANNETGNIFPIAELSHMAHAKGALFHSDCVQVLGKENFDFKKMNVDFATFSTHKFYSLKGCGILFSRKGFQLPNLIYGGGQERQRRGGTENVLGIGAFGKVIPLLAEQDQYIEKIRNLRDSLEERIHNEISDVSWTGKGSSRLCNTSSMVIKGVDGETLLMALDMKGIAVSTGAACSSGNPEPSPVLLSMGLSRAEAQNSLRVSLGWSTTENEIDHFIEQLKFVVAHLRKIEEDNRGK